MPLDEQSTKTELIGPALHSRDWTLTLVAQEVKTGRLSLAGEWSTGTADYVLSVFIGGKKTDVAILEAKAAHRHPKVGAAQARDYARSQKAPFAFATNGHHFVEVNDKGEPGPKQPLSQFPTPEELKSRHPRQQELDRQERMEREAKERQARERQARASRTTYGSVWSALESRGWGRSVSGDVTGERRAPAVRGHTAGSTRYILSIWDDDKKIEAALLLTVSIDVDPQYSARQARELALSAAVPLAFVANERVFVHVNVDGFPSRKRPIHHFPTPRELKHALLRPSKRSELTERRREPSRVRLGFSGMRSWLMKLRKGVDTGTLP